MLTTEKNFSTYTLWAGFITLLFCTWISFAPRVWSATGQQSSSENESLLTHIDGFAAHAGTTGGEGEAVYVVSSTANSGPNTLRDALSKSNRYIVFDESLDGKEIILRSNITISSNNLTLDGRGVDLKITGSAIRFEGDNYILAYLNFGENTEYQDTDSITFRKAKAGGQRFFVYKCDFDHASDGLIDIIWNEGNNVYGTIKLSKFANHNKTILIGTNAEEREGGQYYITFSLNYFLNTTQRLPLSRQAYVHYYNNLIEKWGSQEGYGGGAFSGLGSQYLAENNIAIPYQKGEPHHDGGNVSRPLTKAFAPHFEGQGDVRAEGNWHKHDSYDVELNREQVEDPPYLYSFVPADGELERFILENVGSIERSNPEPNPATPTPVPNGTPLPTVTRPAPPPTATPDPEKEAIKINFQAKAAGFATGYYRDFGEPFGPRTLLGQGEGLKFGWVFPGTNTPLDLEGNGRLRWRNTDHRLDTLMHMQYTGSNGVATEGAWEIELPNGAYAVTVSTGDAKAQASMEIDYLNVEGQAAIANFVRPDTSVPEGVFERHRQITIEVEVSDGRLTIDADGGTNTKINFVEIVPSSQIVNPTPTPIPESTPTASPSVAPTLELATVTPQPTPTIDIVDLIVFYYVPIIGHGSLKTP